MPGVRQTAVGRLPMVWLPSLCALLRGKRRAPGGTLSVGSALRDHAGQTPPGAGGRGLCLLGTTPAPPSCPWRSRLHERWPLAVLELPGSLLHWFLVRTGQIRGLDMAGGVGFYELLMVSLHSVCLPSFGVLFS